MGSAILSFQDSCLGGTSPKFNIALDQILNNNISIFLPNHTAYLKLYTGGLNPKFKSTLGTVSQYFPKRYELVTEQIVFSRTKSATLKYEPEGAVMYNWNGIPNPNIALPNNLGNGSYSYNYIPLSQSWQGIYWTGGFNPLDINGDPVRLFFSDNQINLSGMTVGILNVMYNACFDSLKLISPIKGLIIVEAYTGPYQNPLIYGTATVDFSSGAFNTPRPVSLTVKDACSQQLIKGAFVYIDGNLKGQTDQNGVIALGLLSVGQHTLKITATGYTDSDKDTILNDMFTVPPIPLATA